MDEKIENYLKNSISKILSYFSNTDNNVKIILNKFNSLEKKIDEKTEYLEKLILENKKPLKESGVLKKSTDASDRPANLFGVKVTTNDTLVNPPPDYTPSEINSAEAKKAKNVWQKVFAKDGKPIYMASVKITDDNGNVLKQATTNPRGKWFASLEPGEYTVNIVKNMEKGKNPDINLKMKIKVPAIEQSDFELERLEIPDVY